MARGPFIHAGEEMLRSKPLGDGTFDHNSYSSSDAVNSLKWDDLNNAEYQAVYSYYQGLIAFRKAHPALRMTDAAEVAEKITQYQNDNVNVLSFHIAPGANGDESELFVIFNPLKEAATVNLPAGEWTIYINGEQAGLEALGTTYGTANVEAISAMVLIRTGDAPEVPTDGLTESEALEVIGGADGPTAILVSSRIGTILTAVLGVAAGVAAVAAFFLLKKRKKNSEN